MLVNWTWESAGYLLSCICETLKKPESFIEEGWGLASGQLRKSFSQPPYGHPHLGAMEVVRLFEVLQYLKGYWGDPAAMESILTLECIPVRWETPNGQVKDRISLLTYAFLGVGDYGWAANADLAVKSHEQRSLVDLVVANHREEAIQEEAKDGGVTSEQPIDAKEQDVVLPKNEELAVVEPETTVNLPENSDSSNQESQSETEVDVTDLSPVQNASAQEPVVDTVTDETVVHVEQQSKVEQLPEQQTDEPAKTETSNSSNSEEKPSIFARLFGKKK